jgi:hypothetical protein
MITKLGVKFGGSFQCRLATDPAAATDSPQSPFDAQGAMTSVNGWTFAFQEGPFDRIVRLSGPVELRNALLYKWADTVVTAVAVDRGNGFLAEKDLLLGRVISLGNTKFDAAAGGRAAFEKLVDFKFRIGNLLTADADRAPQLNGLEQDANWQVDYIMRKPVRYLQTGQIDPTRKKVFDYNPPEALSPYLFRDWYAQVFSMRSRTQTVTLRRVSLPRATGILREVGDTGQYDWKLSLSFFQFDPDTLVGNVWGELVARRR